MLAAGIKSPVPMDELELHLREEIEREMKSGLSLNEQEAFHFSVLKFGEGHAVRNEFKKSERTFMKRTLLVLLGIFGVLFGTAFILPALAWYRDHGAMPAEHLEFLLLGVVIAVGGLSTTIYGFKKRKA